MSFIKTADSDLGEGKEKKAVLPSSVVSEILGNHHLCLGPQLFIISLSEMSTLHSPSLEIIFFSVFSLRIH